jgi:hypothetical protein
MPHSECNTGGNFILEGWMDQRELFDTKFFDYRALAPDAATLFFMRDWAVAFTNYNEDLGRTRYWAFLKGFESFDLSYLKATPRFKVHEKLRSFADAHGFRYDLFWQWAFEAHLHMGFHRTFEQVFLFPKILTKIMEYKRIFDENFITYATTDIFKPQNYRNLELQNDYYWYLVYEIKNRYHRDQFMDKIRIQLENQRLSSEFLGNNRSVITSLLGIKEAA